MKIRPIMAVLVTAGAALLLSSCSLIGGGTNTTQRDPTQSITASQTIDAFSIQLGDCVVLPTSDTFSDITVVGCSQAHDAEVINVFDMPDGTFSQDDVDTAGNQCEAAAQSYVGPNYQNLGLDWSYFSPTSDSWANGDREIDCVVYTLSGNPDLTSSVKGQGN